MKLTDKAAQVNFDDLDDESGDDRSRAAAPTSSAVQQPAQRPRTGVAGITERINLLHQVQELQSRVDTYEKGQVVVQLDPARIRESKWKNRHELTFATPAYAELKAEIEAAGGNVQPVKVRRAGKGEDQQDVYEIVYGRRRRRACLELGFPVAAIIEEMDDISLFKEMERENRSRADLSPWEQGVMYKDALDAKLFASQRQMAGELNISVGALNMALALANLPEEIVAAFPSPLELQYRWAADLAAALEKDTAGVMTKARELAASNPRPPAKEVLALLVSAGSGSAAKPTMRELRIADRVVGSVTKDTRGGLQVKVKGGVLTPANEKKLIEFVERLVS